MIDSATLRILSIDGKNAGTGFLVAPNLIVTCAHVITDGESTIQVQFNRHTEIITAHVLPEYLLGFGEGDVTFLRLDCVPSKLGMFFVRLGMQQQLM